MKKILVAIDFLDCSVNALAHAVSIAARAKAGLDKYGTDMDRNDHWAFHVYRIFIHPIYDSYL